MRLTQSDIEAILLLLKRLLIGLLVGGKYMLSGKVEATKEPLEIKSIKADNVSNVTPPHIIRRVKQQSNPELVIEDDVFNIPAIARLRNINMELWEADNIKYFDKVSVEEEEHFETMLEDLNLQEYRFFNDLDTDQLPTEVIEEENKDLVPSSLYHFI